MIRNLLATTALATLISTGAFAQEATTPAPAPAQPAPMTQEAAPVAPVAQANGYLATNIIGETVYNGTGDDAQNIGDVNDIVVAEDGKIESIIVGVGGFLGIGEKNVAVDYATAEWAEKDGDRWLVVPATKEQLEAQAEFDSTPYEPAPAPVAAAPADPAAPANAPVAEAPADPAVPADAPVAEAPADPAAPADAPVAEAPADPVAPADAPIAEAPADPAAPATQPTAEAPAAPATEQMAQDPAPVDPAAPAATAPDTTKTAAIDKSTLTEMPAADIKAEELIGTTVYGVDDANVGEIGDVLLTADGKVDAYIIDVGGFLGVGEKEVAIGSDNLAFMTDKDGNKYLYTSFSKEQLDAAAAYDKSTWAEKRDEQRLIMTQ